MRIVLHFARYVFATPMWLLWRAVFKPTRMISDNQFFSASLLRPTMMNVPKFATHQEASADIAAGKFVVLIDQEQGQGFFAMAASLANDKTIAFAMKHSGGILYAPMTAAKARELGLRFTSNDAALGKGKHMRT